MTEVPAVPVTGQPAVSVLIRSHNDAPYVRRAVLSALGQRADFEFEIVVADDASSDGTLPILLELVRLGKGAISLIRRTHRVGYARNFFETLEACSGRYIAVLDADDFWSSPEKLARQYRLLEMNRQLSAAGHRYLKVHGDATKKRFGQVSRPQSDGITALSFYRGAWIKNSTIMIRADCVSEIPDWVLSSPSEDMAVQALCIEHGDMGFLNDVMAVCQIHGAGVTSALSPSERLEWAVSSWRIIGRHATPELRRTCETRLATKCFDLADLLQADGQDEESSLYRNIGASLGKDNWRRRVSSRLKRTSVYPVVNRLRSLSTLRPIPRFGEQPTG